MDDLGGFPPIFGNTHIVDGAIEPESPKPYQNSET